MINIITYQDGKLVAEIMYLTSQKKSRDEFRKRERVIMMVYYSCCVYMFLEYVMQILNTVKLFTSQIQTLIALIVTFKTVVIFFMLAITGSYLLLLMKKRYAYAYNDQKNSIFAFLLTELVGLMVISTSRYVGWYYNVHIAYFASSLYVYTGIRTSI